MTPPCTTYGGSSDRSDARLARFGRRAIAITIDDEDEGDS
jgi:hypothetical protein